MIRDLDAGYQRAYRRLEARFDLPNPLWHELLRECIGSGGRFTAQQRQQYGDLPPVLLAAVEAAIKKEHLAAGDPFPARRPGQLRLYVMSDLHLEFAPLEVNPEALAACDVVVLAGDIDQSVAGVAWAREAFPDKPIVYVAGNHEFYHQHWDRLIDQLRAAGRTYDVHFLENDAVTIAGVRFLGCTLWSDFDFFGSQNRAVAMWATEKALNDYRLITAGPLQAKPTRVTPERLTAHHTRERHLQSRAWLERELAQGDPASTVVVVHNYVHPNSTAPQFQADVVTAAFGSRLPNELLARARLWIHGHTHSSFDYCLGEADGARIVCNPRGYPLGGRTFENAVFENPVFDDQLLVLAGA